MCLIRGKPSLLCPPELLHRDNRNGRTEDKVSDLLPDHRDTTLPSIPSLSSADGLRMWLTEQDKR